MRKDSLSREIVTEMKEMMKKKAKKLSRSIKEKRNLVLQCRKLLLRINKRKDEYLKKINVIVQGAHKKHISNNDFI